MKVVTKIYRALARYDFVPSVCSPTICFPELALLRRESQKNNFKKSAVYKKKTTPLVGLDKQRNVKYQESPKCRGIIFTNKSLIIYKKWLDYQGSLNCEEWLNKYQELLEYQERLITNALNKCIRQEWRTYQGSLNFEEEWLEYQERLIKCIERLEDSPWRNRTRLQEWPTYRGSLNFEEWLEYQERLMWQEWPIFQEFSFNLEKWLKYRKRFRFQEWPKHQESLNLEGWLDYKTSREKPNRYKKKLTYQEHQNWTKYQELLNYLLNGRLGTLYQECRTKYLESPRSTFPERIMYQTRWLTCKNWLQSLQESVKYREQQKMSDYEKQQRRKYYILLNCYTLRLQAIQQKKLLNEKLIRSMPSKDREMQVFSLQEIVSLLRSMRSGWSLPLEMISGMHNSKYWVMEADVWADLLIVCRWANPTNTIYCQTCDKDTKAVTTNCNHVVCLVCIGKQEGDTAICPECDKQLIGMHFVSAMATPKQTRKRPRMETHKATKKLCQDSLTGTRATRKTSKRKVIKTTPQPITSSHFTTANLQLLFSPLYPARTHWFNMGLAMGVNTETLREIRIKEKEDSGNCLREMLIARLDKQELSKEEVIAALDSPTVGKSTMARDLEIKI